jgi:prevent-host-death family protein
MNTVTIHEAKTHLSRFVDAALAGEDIVITRRRKPVVRLAVVREPVAATKRRTGALPGLVKSMDDDFNAEFGGFDLSLTPTRRRPTKARRPGR